MKGKRHAGVDRLQPELVVRAPLLALAALRAKRPTVLLARERAALELLELRLAWIGGGPS